MCHRARFFVLVTFLKNPAKKRLQSVLSPLSTIFLFVYALCISLGGDIAIIDYALKMGVENDKKDFDLAYVTLHITL